jgi:Fe-S cluster assembly protein SufD
MSAAASIIERAGGIPSDRDEHWQYAALRALRAVPDWSAVPPPAAAPPVSRLPVPTAEFEQLVFVDGHLAGGSLAGATTQIDTLPLPVDHDLRLAALPALARLPAITLELHGKRCVEIWFVCSGATGMVYPRLQLRLAADAAVTLLERQSGKLATGALLCSDLQLQLGAGARMMHQRLHALDAGALVFEQLHARLEAGAAYQVHHIAASRGHARTTALVELAGRESHCEWHCAMNPGERESGDLLLRLLHQAPATVSLSRFRGIATGQARTSCDVDVRVAGAARGARVQQSLKGLSDGAGASVNLRPRLTIDTDDIQAQHGATTGQLDEQLLFYLRSRGLDPDAAARLLKSAFLGEVLAGITDPDLRRAAEAALGRQMTP